MASAFVALPHSHEKKTVFGDVLCPFIARLVVLLVEETKTVDEDTASPTERHAPVRRVWGMELEIDDFEVSHWIRLVS